MKFASKHIIIYVLAALAIAGVSVYVARHWSGPGAAAEHASVSAETPEEADNVAVRFDMEAYDSIRAHYWASTTEAQMADLFQLSLQKALGSPVVPLLLSRDRAGTAAMLANALKSATSTDAERAIAVQTVAVALYNLAPVGHSELLSDKQETAFRESISNVNTGNDLYGQLGLATGASVDSVKAAYAEKRAALEASTSPEAKQALAQAKYAEKVLANPDTKDLYDNGKIEPTLWSRVMGKTLYVNLTKVSPTSLIEFGRTVESASTTPGLDGLVIDLRGNLGGALDFAPAMLGLFIGQNQYAFDFYHQGEYEPQRTTTPYFPELARYRDVVILTDGMTQSTAEAFSASMRRYKLATIVGTRTRGWGTVENTFPLETEVDPSTKYAMLLVHSLTLGADEQPIQDNGVTPDVDASKPGWPSRLSARVSSASVVSAVENALSGPPLQ